MHTQGPTHKYQVLLAYMVLAWAPVTPAQDISQSITRTTKSLSDVPYRAVTDSQQPAPRQELTLGIGYEKDEVDGHAVGIPLQYGYVSADREWNLRLEGGLKRSTSATGSASGLTDVVALATYRLATSPAASSVTWRVLGTAGLGIPVHGDLGSRQYSQQVRLIGVANHDRWTAVLAGVLVHVNGQPPGVGSTVRVLHGEARYDVGGGFAIGKLDRSYLPGAGRKSGATLEYDHQLTKTMEGNVVLTRGLTKGSRSTGIEFDFVHHVAL